MLLLNMSSSTPGIKYLFYLSLILLSVQTNLWIRKMKNSNTIIVGVNSIIRSNHEYINYKNFFNLFIFSEALVFIALFWSWLYTSISPSVEVGNKYNGICIVQPKWWGIGLLNTVILFLSSVFLTQYDITLKLRTNMFYQKLSFKFTILCGLFFLLSQFLEYAYLPPSFRDSVSTQLFLSTTSLHGTHIVIGLILLVISYK